MGQTWDSSAVDHSATVPPSANRMRHFQKSPSCTKFILTFPLMCWSISQNIRTSSKTQNRSKVHFKAVNTLGYLIGQFSLGSFLANKFATLLIGHEIGVKWTAVVNAALVIVLTNLSTTSVDFVVFGTCCDVNWSLLMAFFGDLVRFVYLAGIAGFLWWRRIFHCFVGGIANEIDWIRWIWQVV